MMVVVIVSEVPTVTVILSGISGEIFVDEIHETHGVEDAGYSMVLICVTVSTSSGL